MELPTSRELELEVLLRQRDVQLSELNDEVTRLRQYLSSQPGPSTTTPLSLPPAFSSILLSHVSVGPPGTASPGSSTVVAALTQRARLLQEENDELYKLLRHGETGKLKEEVRGLRRLVERLQGALRQSHESVSTLSRELNKSYESFMNVAQPASNPQLSPRTYPPSPRNNYALLGGNGNHVSKPPPTGPRKRPRLSEANSLPFNQIHPGKPHNVSGHNHNHYGHNTAKRGLDGHPKRGERDARGGNDTNKGNRPSSKMDVDSERLSSAEPSRGRDRDVDREHDRDHDRNRERNRDRDRDRGPKDQDHIRDRDRGSSNNSNSRRTGNGPGRPSGRRGDRAGGGGPHVPGAPFHTAGNATSNNTHSINGDRTLAERMGL